MLNYIINTKVNIEHVKFLYCVWINFRFGFCTACQKLSGAPEIPIF